MGGVPVGLDRAAVSSWCNKKADVFGNFTKQLVSLEIGAQNRFALLRFCSSPSTKLNYLFRIIRGISIMFAICGCSPTPPFRESKSVIGVWPESECGPSRPRP